MRDLQNLWWNWRQSALSRPTDTTHQLNKLIIINKHNTIDELIMPRRKSSKKGDDLPNNPWPSKHVTRHLSRIGLENMPSASSTTAAALSMSTARAASLATTASTSNIHEDDDEDDNNAASFAMAASASNIHEEDDEDDDNDSVPDLEIGHPIWIG